MDSIKHVSMGIALVGCVFLESCANSSAPISAYSPQIEIRQAAIDSCRNVIWKVQVFSGSLDVTNIYTYRYQSHVGSPIYNDPTFTVSDAGTASISLIPSEIRGVDRYIHTVICSSRQNSASLSVRVSSGPLDRVTVDYRSDTGITIK